MGTAETGQVWANLGGVSTIVGGKASATGAGGNTSVVDAGVPDVDMTAIITHGGGANIPGLVFRCSDVSNRWGAFLAPTSGGRVDLYRMAAGTNTTVLSSAKSDYAWAAGREYVLRVVVKADTITVYVDGLNALTYTMSAADLSTFGAFTKVGIRLNNTDAVTRWDNFAVVEAR
jgi:hypothetical protein